MKDNEIMTEKFGTRDKEKFRRESEERTSFKSFVIYQRRLYMLVLSSLGLDISKNEGYLSLYKEWKNFRENPDNFFIELGKEMKEAGIENKNFVDCGAGFGRIIEFFTDCGVFPKKLVLIEALEKNVELITKRVESLPEDIQDKIEIKEVVVDESSDLGGIEADSIILSGVAMYHSPEKFSDIIANLESRMNAGATLSFNNGAETKLIKSPIAHLHFVVKRKLHGPKNEYGKDDFVDYKRVRHYGNNFIFTRNKIE